MIVTAPTILSDRWMLIGYQVRTAFGKLIDLFVLNPDGKLVVIDLKRNQRSLEVGQMRFIGRPADYGSEHPDI